MYSAREFIAVNDLETAYQLLKTNNKNRLLAGGMWLRLGKGKYNNLIDISALGFNTIQVDTSTGNLKIGALTDLRTIETSPVLQERFAGFFPNCVENIVGVQFRNTATIGGNIYCRHGFSDLITPLLVLNCQLHFYKKGVLSLWEYLQRAQTAKGRIHDILLELILPLKADACSFRVFKHTASDLSILNFAAAAFGNEIRVAIGARPAVGKLWQGVLSKERLLAADEALAAKIVADFDFGTNMRASADYRQHIAAPLLLQCLEDLKARL